METFFGEIKCDREQGVSIVLLAILLVAVLGIVAFGFDLARVYVHKRDKVFAADAAALAGAKKLADKGSPREIINEAEQIAFANGVQRSELRRPQGVSVGTWDGRNFVPIGRIGSLRNSNAVAVSLSITTPMSFANLLGVSLINEVHSSIAAIPIDDRSNCFRPIGVPVRALENQMVGDRIRLTGRDRRWRRMKIKKNGWGRREQFAKAMIDGLCDVSLDSGREVALKQGTSNNLRTIFLKMLKAKRTGMVIGVLRAGRKFGVIEGFAQVDIVRNTGRGRRWLGELKIRRFMDRVDASMNLPEGTRYLVQ